MNSTKLKEILNTKTNVWEICKFWILQNHSKDRERKREFERYVNFEFYKTLHLLTIHKVSVWEICKFWILQNEIYAGLLFQYVWEICKFWILQNHKARKVLLIQFERYVNFEFYKTLKKKRKCMAIVWEICKFWILQNELYRFMYSSSVWEICKFWILQNKFLECLSAFNVWEICKFWILQNRLFLQILLLFGLRDM